MAGVGGSEVLYLSFLRSPIGTGLTEIRGKVEMEPCDWLLANEEVSRLSGDCGGVMRLGLLHSEWDREPGTEGGMRKMEDGSMFGLLLSKLNPWPLNMLTGRVSRPLSEPSMERG